MLQANYAASVVFGALAIALLFVFAWNEHNLLSMRLCLVACGAAWLACYAGAACEGHLTSESLRVLFAWTSLLATLAALVFVLWAFAMLRS